jgi:predicted nucleic acid-binding protein
MLDAGPIGLLCQPRGKTQGDRCREWVVNHALAGSFIGLPEIAVYEVRRELIRLDATAGLRRLNEWIGQSLYIPIDTRARERAATLWASLRRDGVPTASPDALDADCILAAQSIGVVGIGDTMVIATTNPAHLIRFPGIEARLWDSIG